MTDQTAATVTVVDDDAEIAELYTRFLTSRYQVRTATGGREALDKIDETVDVALLDRRMPEMTGDEVLTELRRRGLDCQVAMLTAVEPEGEIVDMAFEEYETKPVGRKDLIRLIEVLSERATYDEQSQEYFNLASKKAALEVAGNDDTGEYDELVEQMEYLRENIDATLDRIGAEAAFSELPAG